MILGFGAYTREFIPRLNRIIRVCMYPLNRELSFKDDC